MKKEQQHLKHSTTETLEGHRTMAIIKLAATLVIAVAGLTTHALVTEEQQTHDAMIVQSDLRIFDPRPYLAPPTTIAEQIVVAQSTTKITRCTEWIELAASVGVKADEMKMAMRILYRESRCNPKSVNSTKNRNGSIDYGLSQINDETWCLPSRVAPRGWLQQAGVLNSCADLLDAETNLRAMVAVMRYAERTTGCAWHPWLLCDEE